VIQTKGSGKQGLHMQGDLVQRLRDRAYSGLPDPLSEQAADEIERLREAIHRYLADQDATLSVHGGNVTVTLDATLTDEERQAVEWAANAADPYYTGHTATLRGLLERTKTV
jgi:hypothetical protein